MLLSISYSDFVLRVEALRQSVELSPPGPDLRAVMQEDLDALLGAFPHFALAFALELELAFPKS